MFLYILIIISLLKHKYLAYFGLGSSDIALSYLPPQPVTYSPLFI